MFNYKRLELTDVIYESMSRTEFQGMKRESVDMMLQISDSVRDHDFRAATYSSTTSHQPLQYTGSECMKMRSCRSATVCLMLLCVLLLTAVIVLCVLINTNNHQCHINNKDHTEERDTSEREHAVFKNLNLVYAKMNGLQIDLDNMGEWIYYKFSLYFISFVKRNWTESRRYCRERGADLIIINNREEQDFVKKMFGSVSFWIGLSDSDEEGMWKWVDGSTLITRFWATLEPNGYGYENCVVSYTSVWYDYPCTRAYRWICEKSTLINSSS